MYRPFLDLLLVTNSDKIQIFFKTFNFVMKPRLDFAFPCFQEIFRNKVSSTLYTNSSKDKYVLSRFIISMQKTKS